MAVVLWICARGEGLLSLGDWDTVLGKHYQLAAVVLAKLHVVLLKPAFLTPPPLATKAKDGIRNVALLL